MSKREALIIASYEYQNPSLRKLIAPSQDAESLSRVLSDPKIGNFEVETLLSASSYKVNQKIEAFFSDRKSDDLLLLYFTGHGIKDDDGLLYFATYDTNCKMLRTTAIPATLVNDLMRNSRSRRQILLLDCCYGGAFARGMVAKADKGIGTKERLAGRGRAVMTASDSMQYAFEGDEISGESTHSIFTRSLVRGLESGEADLNQDGNISFDELYEYVYDRVSEETPKQKPEKWDFGVQGEFIIARNPNPVVKATELPPALQESIVDPRTWVREGTVSELNRLLQSNSPGIVKAAQEALEKLVEDDSRRVSEAATKYLSPFASVEAERLEAEKADAERIAAEKAEAERIAAEKAEVKRLALEKDPMMINTIASSAVAALAPYLVKVSEKKGKELGKVVGNTIGDLYQTIKARFQSRPAAVEALTDVENNPNDGDAQTALRLQLKKEMQEDATFIETIRQYLEGIQQDKQASTFLTQVYGGEVGKIISIGSAEEVHID